jgi:type IV pilus assembly protein PilQ
MSQIAARTERTGRARLVGKTGLLAILWIAACGSNPPAGQPSLGANRDVAPVGAAALAPTEIQSVELTDGQPGVQVRVATSGPLVWTSYRDADGNLVVELPNSLPVATIAGLDLQQGMVESARLLVEDNADRPLTRLVVRTAEPAEHSVAAEGDRLLVDLVPVGTPFRKTPVHLAVTEEPIGSSELLPRAEGRIASAAASPLPSAQAPPIGSSPSRVTPALGGTPDNPLPGPSPSGVPATQLQGVEVTSDGDATVVWVLGDGEFFYSTFPLNNPERFVVDLSGVVKTAPLSTVPVGTDQVERVRVAQFKPQPDLVSRVVIDLKEPLAPEIEPGVDGLKLIFRSSGSAAMPASMPAPAPAQEEALSYETEDVGAPAAMTTAVPPRVESPAEPLVASLAPTAAPTSRMAASEPEPEPAPAAMAPPPAPRVEPRPEPMPPTQRPDSGVPLFGASPAPATGTPVVGTDTFASRPLGGAAPTWEGEPMVMTLKDADIKDVLRSFARISGLNIVVQPGVSGTVTVELNNVPWDQALHTILKTNGLDYQLEGNIMRIAPIAVLRAEAEEQQKLVAAQALSIPLSTIIRRVSYATAGDIARVLRAGGGASVMSARGTVVVDDRTNTLIIKELPAVMGTVISVIENLDIPEPQVSIEARIVETTKRFTRSLGVQWSFDALADPEHGNTTGLQFPNNGTAGGGVNLLTGAANGFLDISLGNVLNTFRLDAALQAAENEGLINILSAPKITTLNNERASIQSGLQIPIQTVANNTVSVQFINATLRLDVVPHVTAAGTVLMDIDIQKREPQIAFTVAGAANAPIATKDARTRVIVKDGGTAVIGGIYKVSSDQGEDRVPGLSNIPILKHLFKNRRRVDENEELLIFITPQVVKL